MPGLSGSLWASVSGLLTHGQKMNVVTNNLANVSTIGFKAQRMDFNDYLYIGGGSTSGPTQIGAGVSVYAVLGDFSQGSLESTNSVTDIAIDGNGFFGVRATNSRQKFFTRAGDFYFNTDRELQNPEGLIVQGWKVNNERKNTFSTGATTLGIANEFESAYVGYGTPKDVVLDSWNVKPQQTLNVTFTMGLTNSLDQDKTPSSEYAMSSLFTNWDATAKPPLADKAYATQSSIDVYDEGGSTHTLTVYYDLVSPNYYSSEGDLEYKLDGLPAGYTVYEYLVTIPPEQDNRSYGGTGFDPVTNKFKGNEPKPFYDPTGNDTKKMAGVLMTGQLIFDPSGQLVTQSAYTYAANDKYTENNPNNQSQLSPDNMESWQPTRFSSNGLPVFLANFTGQPLANSVNERIKYENADTPVSQAQEYIIEMDFGLKSIDPTWKSVNKNIEGNLTDLIGRQRLSADFAGAKKGAEIFKYYDKTTGEDKGSYVVPEDGNFKGKKVWGSFASGTPAVTYFVVGDDPNSLSSLAADGTTAGPAVPTNYSHLPNSGAYYVDYLKTQLMGGPVRQDYASVSNVASPTVRDSSQDGYGSGTLSTVNIDNAGVIYGYFTNGQTLPLYQIAIYDFKNYQGLRREGGNLYGQTNESGEARLGVAGDNGFGKTRAYNIEQSNVDMAREFVQMIATQRGFQANTKGVTTVDTMLETVIGMKR